MAETDVELAERAARAAGELLLGRFRESARGVERKSTSTDMVSDADRDAEALLHDLLTGERPDDGLLGEEGASVAGSSGREWVVDPLDGTTNFLYGLPGWAVSVAVRDGEGSLAGVVYDPVRDEAFTAVRGGGSRLDGRVLGVADPPPLARALVATGFGYETEQRAIQSRLLTDVLPAVRDIRRMGAAAVDLCLVACGRVDAYYERNVKPWDWAAGRLVAEEAGAVVRDLEGEPHGLLAAAPGLVDELAAFSL